MWFFAFRDQWLFKHYLVNNDIDVSTKENEIKLGKLEGYIAITLGSDEASQFPSVLVSYREVQIPK